jgi:outer membrane protein TolC
MRAASPFISASKDERPESDRISFTATDIYGLMAASAMTQGEISGRRRPRAGLRPYHALAVLALGLNAAVMLAQSPAPVTIGAAIEAATKDYPTVKEATARAAAATAAVDESQAAYVPRLDALWQLNRASRNNVFGLLLPQSIVPPISGPVLGTDTFESAWGSAAGLLFSAEVFDFGRRSASVSAARAQATSREAESVLARLTAGVAVADAYLTALGAQQTVIAARANVTRLETLHGVIKAQVDAELKPGADQSRVDAELAAARNRLVTAEQVLAIAKLTIAEAMGRGDVDVALDAGSLLSFQPALPARAETLIANHPAVIAATESAKAADLKREVTRLSFRPRLFFNGALAARASGANVDGTIDATHGLWPDVPNWAAGLTVSFPFLDHSANRARLAIDTAEADASRAQVQGVTQRKQIEVRQAEVLLDAAARIASQIPVQLSAARQADAQARARYEAGLTGILEVADAQRLLAQAESEEALASLAVWRARLALAAATGDLVPFITEAANPTGIRVRP